MITTANPPPTLPSSRYLPDPLHDNGIIHYGTNHYPTTLPIIEVRYTNLRYSLPILQRTNNHPPRSPTSSFNDKPLNILQALGNSVLNIGRTVTKPCTNRLITSKNSTTDPTVRSVTSPDSFLHVLGGISGVFRPGSSTLIISAPGGGGTTFLRLLAGRVPLSTSPLTLSALQAIRYNGRTRQELEHTGISIAKLVGFTPETDDHEPLLTVKETLDFAANISQPFVKLPSSSSSSHPASILQPLSADEVIRILDLEEAENTRVGSAIIRGISGGQRRRVTIGESLVSNARILCLDSITNGLDAATAMKIITYLTTWARTTGGIVVAVLQQPSPEMANSFDDVILLSEGLEIYHGPFTFLETYLNSLHYYRPQYMDLADFASEVVAYPPRAAKLSLQDRQDRYNRLSPSTPRTASLQLTGETSIENRTVNAIPSSSIPLDSPSLLTIPDLANYWQNSTSFYSMMGTTVSPLLPDASQVSVFPPSLALDVNYGRYPRTGLSCGIVVTNPYAQRQYGNQRFAKPVHHQSWLLMQRAMKTSGRDTNFVIARLINSTIMGIILATLFNNSPPSAFQVRFGLALFSSIFIGFTNNAQVPAAIQSRQVVGRHTASRWFPSILYIIANVLATLPIAIIADLIYTNLVYWTTGFDTDFLRYLIYFLAVFLIDMTMAAYLRCQAYAWPSLEIASSVGTGIISIWLLTAGFYVIRNQMPVFLAWLCWISPFFWIVTIIANNEFSAPRYQTPSSSVPGAPTIGQTYMNLYDFPFSPMAKWGGVIFLTGLWLLFLCILSPIALNRHRYRSSPGTVRTRSLEREGGIVNALAVEEAFTAANIGGAGGTLPIEKNGTNDIPDTTKNGAEVPVAMEEPPTQRRTSGTAEVQEERKVENPIPPATVSTTASPSRSISSFPPVTLAFQNVWYTIPYGKRNQTRDLLCNIWGYFLPGTLTALMGATGAGKTTLLDVLASRKTTGVTKGDIQLNGAPSTPIVLSRIAAYAEQDDIHMPLTTVKEALEFSYDLRFTTPDETKVATNRNDSTLPLSSSLVPTKPSWRDNVSSALHHPVQKFLPPRTAQRTRFIATLLQVLELDIVTNRTVHSLSRGERKRLSIGVELASNPSLLFCDEPTTNLDSRSAAVVMRVLRRVASTGRTVICTIHQPSAEIFFSFDKLLLLAPGGKQVYFGNLEWHALNLIRYFEGLAPPIIPRFPYGGKNPAAWMLEILNYDTRSLPSTPRNVAPTEEALAAASSTVGNGTVTETVNPDVPRINFAEAYERSRLAYENRQILATVLRTPGGVTTGPQKHAPSSSSSIPVQTIVVPAPLVFRTSLVHNVGYQWIQVYKRANVDYWRNADVFLSRVYVNTFLGVLFGLLYLRNDLLTFAGTQSGLGFILGGTAFCAIIFIGSSATLQFERRAVFYRERAARFYQAPVYSFTVFLVELPYVAVVVMIFTAISYWLAGLRANAGSFFFFYLGAFILSCFFLSIGIATAALAPSLPVAQIISGLTISISFLMAGLFINSGQIPPGWIGLYYAVPTSHILRALGINQFYCVPGPDTPTCPTIQSVNSQGQPVVVDRFQYVENYLLGRTTPVDLYLWGELGWATLAVIVTAIIAMIALQYINYQKR